MKTYRFDPGSIHILGLAAGDDLVAAIEEFVGEHRIEAAWLSYLGAVSRASLRFYDQREHEYRDFVIDQHLEVLSGTGNVSVRDGAPFVHTHAAFGDAAGHAFGGHVNRGTIVFALEVEIRELIGDPPVRGFDETTGLALWNR